MKRSSIALGHLALLLVLTTPGAALAHAKVAVINSPRALEESAAGQKAMGKLQKKLESLMANLKAREDQLKQKMDAFNQAQKAGKPRDQLKKLMEELETDQRLFHQEKAAYEDAAERERTRALEPVQRLLSDVLRRIAEQEGYELVVERSAAPYLRPDLDITERVITEMNAAKVQ